MQIWGVAWWQLLGMFGFGAAFGLCVSLAFSRWLIKPVRGDWPREIFRVLFTGVGIIAAMPLFGMAAVLLTFAAPHAGGGRLLVYPAGAGLVFLVLLAGWVFRLRVSSQRATGSVVRKR